MRSNWRSNTLLGLLLAAPATIFADDADSLRKLNDAYRAAWLRDDPAGVLALFEAGAQISPSGMCPIEGLDDIRSFWFPDDGSVTTIHRYEAEDVGAAVIGDVGVTTEKTLLEWSYEKGETRTGRIQNGVQTTVFRRQPDGTWKVWRKMWTDVAVRDQ